jgi:ankyrin repeat protein
MSKQSRHLRLVVVVSVLAVLVGIPGCYYWSTREYHPTALHTAAENNDVPAIKEWIARGKNLDQGLTYPGGMESSGLRGVTALMLAAERGNEEAAAALIKGGANIYLEDEDLGPYTGVVVYNRTALDYAVAGGSRRIVTMLADRWKGKPLTRRGQQDLLLAWENMCNGPYLARLTAPYADGKWVAGFVFDRLLTKEEAQRALVQESEHAGCPDHVSFLLERHVRPTPEMLIQAIRFGRTDFVMELLAAGADVNGPWVTRMALGVTPPQTTMMPLAAAVRSTAMTKILLNAGAEVNGQNDEGRTALHYAVEGDWQYANDYSRLLAAMDGIELLVSRGARTGLRDKNGKLPADFFEGTSRRNLGRLRSRMVAALDLPGDKFPRSEGDHAVIARICVDSAGDLTQTPEIVESSGVPKLDSAAVQLVSRGATRFAATGGNSQRGTSCLKIAIEFPPPPLSNGPLDFRNCPPPPLRGPCNRSPTPAYACVTSSGYDELRVLKGLRCDRRSG